MGSVGQPGSTGSGVNWGATPDFPTSPSSTQFVKNEYPSVPSIVDQLVASAPIEPNAAPQACIPDTVQLFFFTISIPSAAVALPDVPVNLPFPVTRVLVASWTPAAETDSLFFHLSPIGNNYAATASPSSITPVGTEQWLPWPRPAGSSTSKVGQGFKFCKPITRFYLDIGHEHGGGPSFLTLCCTNDLDEWNVQGQTAGT